MKLPLKLGDNKISPESRIQDANGNHIANCSYASDAKELCQLVNMHQDLLDALAEINRDAWSEDKGVLRSIARKTDELLTRARQ